jgi:hypothetical protein
MIVMDTYQLRDPTPITLISALTCEMVVNNETARTNDVVINITCCNGNGLILHSFAEISIIVQCGLEWRDKSLLC